MAEKPRSRSSRSATTSEEYATPGSSQLPGADYSYTVELVAKIQNQLGVLTEAVDSLKTQSQEHGNELKGISRDVYAAKVILGLVGGLIVAICTVIAFLVNTYISTLGSAQ